MAASLVVIAIHHLGYREFRRAAIGYPLLGCAVFSLAYLLTGSILAAIGGHIVLHAVAIVRGTELPPRSRARAARAANPGSAGPSHGAKRSHHGPEVSEHDRPITVEQYERAEVQLQTEGARRGFLVHAAIFLLGQAALITINLVVASDFLWFPFPLIGWGVGLTMHYLFGFRWAEREVRRHQEQVEQRALRLIG